jgi:hypothetical protein
MFGFHPLNLAFRLVLELAAIAALAVGGYAVGELVVDSGVFPWVLAIGLPLTAIAAWGVFNVPGDRSRSGEAPVPVVGIVRLIVELDVFGAAVVVVWFANPAYAVALGACVVIHYGLSLDRIRWLLTNEVVPKRS